MKERLKARPFLVVITLVTIAFYQNCSQDPNNTNDVVANSEKADLPFAYHATVDTISYMSCTDMTDKSFDTRAYYTFRAGAYNNTTGGMSLTQNFLNATQYYSNTARGNILADSDINSSIIVELSVRNSSNFQDTPWTVSGESGPGLQQDAFLPALDSAEIAGPLASMASGHKINYFPGDEPQRLMEASLRFLTYANLSNQLLQDIGSSSSILTVGYTTTADVMDPSLRSPLDQTNSNIIPPTNATNATYNYATGYLMSFNYPARAPTGGDLRVLSTSGIQEWDYSVFPRTIIPSQWACPTAYQFMIVRPEDYGSASTTAAAYQATGCQFGVDAAQNSTEQSELLAIRRVLRAEDWWVDVTHNCVMPKNTGDYCYGSTLNARGIMYDYASCADTATTVCPHYVSICVRQGD